MRLNLSATKNFPNLSLIAGESYITLPLLITQRSELNSIMNRHTRGTIEIIISAICFGSLSVFARVGYKSGFTAVSILSYRFLLASLLMWIIFSLFFPKLTKVSARQAAAFFLLGVISNINTIFMFLGLERISAPLAIMLLYTYPAMVLILTAIFFRERATGIKLASLTMSLSGIYLLLGAAEQRADSAGVILVIAAALVYAIYIVMSQKILKGVSAYTGGLYINTFAAATILPLHAPTLEEASNISPIGWLAIIMLAVVGTFVARLLLLAGVEKIGAGEASLLSTLEPLVTVALAYLILGEKLTLGQLGGGALILAGVLSLQLHNRWRKE